MYNDLLLDNLVFGCLSAAAFLAERKVIVYSKLNMQYVHIFIV